MVSCSDKLLRSGDAHVIAFVTHSRGLFKIAYANERTTIRQMLSNEIASASYFNVYNATHLRSSTNSCCIEEEFLICSLQISPFEARCAFERGQFRDFRARVSANVHRNRILREATGFGE